MRFVVVNSLTVRGVARDATPDLAALATGCFPSWSEYYACESDADCEDGRVCNQKGFCIVRAPDAGPNDAAQPDATIDSGVAIDANTLAMECQAAGYVFAPVPSGYYRIISSATSWTNAQAQCNAHLAGATHLIVLSTPQEAARCKPCTRLHDTERR